jgi:hypothetical protein
MAFSGNKKTARSENIPISSLAVIGWFRKVSRLKDEKAIYKLM